MTMKEAKKKDNPPYSHRLERIQGGAERGRNLNSRQWWGKKEKLETFKEKNWSSCRRKE